VSEEDDLEAIDVAGELGVDNVLDRRRFRFSRRQVAILSVSAVVLAAGVTLLALAQSNHKPALAPSSAASSSTAEVTGATTAVTTVKTPTTATTAASPPPVLPPPVFVRTTSEGISIRVAVISGYLAPYVSNAGASFLLEGIHACAVTNPASMYVAPQGIVGTGKGVFTVAPVLVAPAVARVAVRFADGFTDSMKPLHGIAFLAHQGKIDSYTVSTFDASEKALARTSINFASFGTSPPCPAQH
jgi:hypothetical protein